MFVIGTLKPNDIFELLPGMLFCDRVMRSHVPYSFGSLFYFKDSSLLFRFYVSAFLKLWCCLESGAVYRADARSEYFINSLNGRLASLDLIDCCD